MGCQIVQLVGCILRWLRISPSRPFSDSTQNIVLAIFWLRISGIFGFAPEHRLRQFRNRISSSPLTPSSPVSASNVVFIVIFGFASQYRLREFRLRISSLQAFSFDVRLRGHFRLSATCKGHLRNPVFHHPAKWGTLSPGSTQITN